jgi:hypothetical protein
MSKESKNILCMLAIALLLTILNYIVGNLSLSNPYDIGRLLGSLIGQPAISVFITWFVNLVINLFRKNKKPMSIIFMWIIFVFFTMGNLLTLFTHR